MIAAFTSGLGGTLADRWATALLSPAFGFWALGLGAWLVSRDGPDEREELVHAVETLGPVAQAGLIVLGLLVVMVCSVAADHAAFTVIRVLEGYWPRWLAWPFVSRLRRRHARLDRRWQELMRKEDAGTASAAEQAELARLESRLAAMPADPGRLMPTRLGNLLRAAEDGVTGKYGLDAVRCWAPLWLVLGELTRTELDAARAALDSSATWWLWACLLLVWVVFTPWAVPVALIAAAVTYAAVLAAGAQYGRLIDAAYAIHRGQLYDALGIARPATPAAEHEAGRRATAALVRGPDAI